MQTRGTGAAIFLLAAVQVCSNRHEGWRMNQSSSGNVMSEEEKLEEIVNDKKSKGANNQVSIGKTSVSSHRLVMLHITVYSVISRRIFQFYF